MKQLAGKGWLHGYELTEFLDGPQPGLLKRSDPPPVPELGQAPARHLPAHGGREIAAAEGASGTEPEIALSSTLSTYKPVAKVRWLARSSESAVGSPRNDRNLASRGRNSAFSDRIDVQSDR